MTCFNMLRGGLVSTASIGILAGVIGLKSMNSDVDPCAGLCANQATDQLFYGVVQGDVEQVRRVLKHGDLQVDQRDALGVTALFASITGPRERSGEVLMMLIRAHADVNAADPVGATPLMYAAAMHNDEAVKILLAQGADANAQDNAGQTAMDYARDSENPVTVDLLATAVTSPLSSD